MRQNLSASLAGQSRANHEPTWMVHFNTYTSDWQLILLTFVVYFIFLVVCLKTNKQTNLENKF